MTLGAGAGGLLGPAEVRDLAALLGVTPTKKLGQNFVHDPNTVRKIVRLAGVTDRDHVLEIGPGLGSLTLGLTETGARVTAIEIDGRLAAQLPTTARELQPDARLEVVCRDALELTHEDLRDPHTGEPTAPTTLVANLPYNVSVPILIHVLALVPSLARGLVMVQAEVGHRIAAKPGSKEYGAPSVKVAWYGEWSIAGTVSRNIFWPVPGVDSVLVSFARHAEPLGSADERERTFAMVNSAFAQRRKMLRQSLQGAIPGSTTASVSELLERLDIDPAERAEGLSVHDFHRIARAATFEPR